MARWGEVGKVYAQRKDGKFYLLAILAADNPAPSGYDPNHAKSTPKKHQSANFSEAWVEFLDKSIAKTVAEMLNAQVIGGKKGDRCAFTVATRWSLRSRWRDDIWTMKYLSGFKWEMLGEQVGESRRDTHEVTSQL